MNSLKVIPLGGLGEIGNNMMVFEYGDDIIVIDAGLMFPSESISGARIAIPDITYLKNNKDRVRAILITHGHEDHIGALPWVLSDLNVPVYAPKLAHGLIKVKLREHGILRNVNLEIVNAYEQFDIGNISVQFFPVCHSIPDAMGIILKTPLGLIVHTGDFKIDHTPEGGNLVDFPAFMEMVSDQVLLLCSDSTYAENDGYTPSDRIVGETLGRVIGESEGRVLIATFASLISRVQQIIDAAVKHHRKVAVIGRSMISNVKMATKMGYLNVPDGTIITLTLANDLPANEVVIIATGAQGEPTSALVRVANREHPDLEIMLGDTVVISASPIPGNETLIAKTIDNLYRQGAEVLYSKIAMVHVHGHASREELKLMLALVKPRYFVPIHGEYRHLVAHARIANTVGVSQSNTFVIEDGDVLEFTQDHAQITGSVVVGRNYVA